MSHRELWAEIISKIEYENMEPTRIYAECYFCHRKVEIQPEEFEDYINGRLYPIGKKCEKRWTWTLVLTSNAPWEESIDKSEKIVVA